MSAVLQDNDHYHHRRHHYDGDGDHDVNDHDDEKAIRAALRLLYLDGVKQRWIERLYE